MDVLNLLAWSEKKAYMFWAFYGAWKDLAILLCFINSVTGLGKACFFGTYLTLPDRRPCLRERGRGREFGQFNYLSWVGLDSPVRSR